MGRKNRKEAGAKINAHLLSIADTLDRFIDTLVTLKATPVAMVCLYRKNGIPTTRLETPLPREAWALLAEELRKGAEELLKGTPIPQDTPASASEGQPPPAAATT